MSRPPESRAAVVSVREMGKLVDEAVAAVTAGSKGIAPQGSLMMQAAGGVVGRIVADFAAGHSFAEAVSAEMVKNGVQVEPAVLMVGGRTIGGFIEKAVVPAIREF
jgi:hypothetical protein